MEESHPSKQEIVGDQLIEDMSQLQCFALGEGAAVCEVCGEELREGAPVVVFAFRPVDQPAFEIGHLKCTGCRHEPTEFLTLRVLEFVLDDRVGTYSRFGFGELRVRPPDTDRVPERAAMLGGDA